MNVSRLVTLAAALIITAAEWLAFSSLPVQAQAARPVAAPAASAAPEAAVQEIVVIGSRSS